MSLTVKHLFKRLVRVILWFAGGIIVIVIVVLILIQVPAVQNYAKQKALTYLQRKLGTPVRLDRLRIIFPKEVVLEGLYLEDQHHDTLLAGSRIKVDISMFALLKKQIDISRIDLEGISANVYRLGRDTAFNYAYILKAFASAPDTTHKVDTSGGFSFRVGTLHLHHITGHYRDTVSGQDVQADLGDMVTHIGAIDPAHGAYSVPDITLDSLSARVRQRSTHAMVLLRGLSLRGLGLIRSDATLGEIRLDSTDLSYDNDAQKRLATGLDYNHLKVSSLVFQADHAAYAPLASRVHIRTVAFREQSGLRLKKLTADIMYGATASHIRGLDIETDGSSIRNETDARYPSIDTLSKNLALLYLNTHLDRSTISEEDLRLFAPALKLGSVFLNGSVNGYVNDLNIPGLEARALRKTSVSLRGRVRGLPEATKAVYDIQVLHLVTDSADICALAPMPASLHLPRDISATGSFKGTINAFQALLDAATTRGQARVQGNMNLRAHSYLATVSTQALDLGYILGQSQNLGKLTLRASARGKGFSYPGLRTDATVKLSQGTIRGYAYTNLGLTVHYDHGQGTLHSDIDDPAIRYQLDATAAAHGKYPSLHLVLHLDTLDAGALHLVTDTLQASGLLTADFASTNPDSLQGNLDLLHWSLHNDGRLLHADSIALVATHPADSQYVHVFSDALVLDMKGKFAITQVPGALERTINHYYVLPGYKVTTVSAQSWDLHALVTPTPLLLSFAPALKGSDTIGLHTTFNSAQNDLRLSLVSPRIFYGTDTVHRLDVQASTRAEALDYRLQIESAAIGGFDLNRASVSGRVAHNRLFTSVLLKDDKNKDWYRIAATLADSAGYTVVLDPDSLLLNHDAWTVSRDNFLHYSSSGVVAHDFTISRQDQSLTINSLRPEPSAPLDVTFSHFRISTLTQAAGQDSVIADGVIDGKAEVAQVTTNPVFTSNLSVHDLSVHSDTLGNLIIKVDNKVANTYAADISLKGHGSDVRIDGNYVTGSGMDLTLHLNAFNLASVEPFAAGQLDDIKGQLRGQIHLTGTPAKFVPEGNLHFDSAIITPHITGEPLHLSNDQIEFDNTGFNFSMFTLRDSAGNKATVDGNAFTTDFRNIKFDMAFNANNFRLVNAQPSNDRLFYGKLNLDAAVNLEGDVTAPKVDGDIRINKKTDFTFVLPEPDPEVASRQGVVRFVDRNHPGDTALIRMDSLTATAPMKGINISANIETDSAADFTMVIDQRNGDALKIRGRSHLNFGMDESGKTSLTGGYEIDQGSYSLTLEVLKRTFLLQRGSTITWTGDPTSAQINLVADYPINTAPIDLVENEISGRSATDINKFKQKLPFTVALKMTGELLKPIITFDVTLPSSLSLQWPDVETKLEQIRSDPSELNKQVFALLLLGRFVGDNPLESGAGGTSAGQMAFQSASQLLTAQLNQLAASLIKGVDVSFDLNNSQDYSTGQEQDQTDLGVTVSKSLFNERIKVNVGSDFELAGAYPNQNASNIAGDLSVDYQLTKDGRYMVRAYRKNQYEVVVEGQVVETGVSFILTLDYNKFREIFGKYKAQQLEERKRQHGS